MLSAPTFVLSVWPLWISFVNFVGGILPVCPSQRNNPQSLSTTIHISKLPAWYRYSVNTEKLCYVSSFSSVKLFYTLHNSRVMVFMGERRENSDGDKCRDDEQERAMCSHAWRLPCQLHDDFSRWEVLLLRQADRTHRQRYREDRE